MRTRPTPLFLFMIWIASALLTAGIANAQTSGLTITLDKFGVGNEARAGDTAGIRLILVDSSASNRTVMVRLSRLDPDGDTIESERVVTTNPGVQQGVWFYVRVPYDIQSRRPETGFVATAYEAKENESPSAGAPLFSAGRVLARLPLDARTARIHAPTSGLIAITGTAHMGLRAYGLNATSQASPWVPGRGEVTDTVEGIRVADMPDQWDGWAPYEALIWTAGEPSELKGERARAIREWVERGGHLVIVLPSVGQTWTNRESDELFSILPTVNIRRREGVDMEAYRAMLVGRKQIREVDDAKNQVYTRPLPMPKRAVVHTFTPMPEANVGDALRILDGPDGECVVARRLVGLGSVTLVGLELASCPVDPQAFWHRVLGKRGKIMTSEESKRAQSQGISGTETILDRGIGRELNERQQGKSATGLLLGFILFIVYWLVAGPMGFAILKQRRLTAHAWVMFFMSAVAFTAIAWAGATALRPKKIEVSHLTLFDHVYGQPTQRSRTWASILLPSYGDSTIRVGEPDAASASTTTWDFISPWETNDDAAAISSFPDARAYRVDARTPDSIRVPTRATVKEIIADWAGGTRWRMPVPEPLPDGTPTKIHWKDQGPGKPPILSGVLKHELPGTLKDLKILIVREQDDFPQSGFAPRDMWFSRTTTLYYEQWPPGEPLDLELLQGELQPGKSNVMVFLNRLVPAPASTGMGFGSAPTQQEDPHPSSRMLSAMFTPLLPGPDLNPLSGVSPAIALRNATQCWDIASWFTHPCLIIVGELEGPMPTPIFVNGVATPSIGKTYVRWMYPLPDKTPGFQNAKDGNLVPDPSNPDPSSDPSPDTPDPTGPQLPG